MSERDVTIKIIQRKIETVEDSFRFGVAEMLGKTIGGAIGIAFVVGVLYLVGVLPQEPPA